MAARKGYPPVIPDAFNVALQNGQLEVAKWLREIGIELGPYAIDEAAKGGDLKTLKWVVETKDVPRMTERVCFVTLSC